MTSNNEFIVVPEPEYSIRVKKGKCVLKWCTKDAGKKRKYCYKHARKKQKIYNPLRYWFDVLRQNARSRKIEFELTIEEFKDFCEETGYLELKGKGADNLSIDRKNPHKGYTRDNIQLLTLANNSRKRFIDMKILFGYYPSEEELKLYYGGDKSVVEGIKNSKQEEENDSLGEAPF